MTHSGGASMFFVNRAEGFGPGSMFSVGHEIVWLCRSR